MPSRPATVGGFQVAASVRSSCRILRILFDVVVGEIVGPDSGGVRAVAQVDLEMHLAPAHVHKMSWLADGSIAAYLHAVEGDVNAFRFKVRGCCADGRQYPPPIGILPEDSALEEIAASDRSAHLDCILLRGRMLHLDGNRVGRSLRVDEQLHGKVM